MITLLRKRSFASITTGKVNLSNQEAAHGHLTPPDHASNAFLKTGSQTCLQGNTPYPAKDFAAHQGLLFLLYQKTTRRNRQKVEERSQIRKPKSSANVIGKQWIYDLNRILEQDSLINGLKVQVRNFSHRLLTNQEQKLSSLSINFRPTTTPIIGSDLNNQLKDFARSIRLMFQFAGSVEEPNFNPRLYVKNQDYEPYLANLETENSLKGMKAILGKVV